MISESPKEQSDLKVNVRHLAENTVIQQSQNVIDCDNNLIKTTEKDNGEKSTINKTIYETKKKDGDPEKQNVDENYDEDIQLFGSDHCRKVLYI